MNGQNSNLPDNLFTVNLLKDKFNQLLLVKKQEIARVEYNAKKDESKIFELQPKKLPKIYTLPGKKLIKIVIKGNALESEIE